MKKGYLVLLLVVSSVFLFFISFAVYNEELANILRCLSFFDVGLFWGAVIWYKEVKK